MQDSWSLFWEDSVAGDPWGHRLVRSSAPRFVSLLAARTTLAAQETHPSFENADMDTEYEDGGREHDTTGPILTMLAAQKRTLIAKTPK